MTGFSRQELNGAEGTLVCEIRSVNHRFLEASLRLPESCRALESELRATLTRELRRGKVDCTIQHRAPSSAAAGLDIDGEALAGLLGRARELAAALPGAAQINVLGCAGPACCASSKVTMRRCWRQCASSLPRPYRSWWRRVPVKASGSPN
jgi:uncharacterized protein (TIGR00255 family)